MNSNLSIDKKNLAELCIKNKVTYLALFGSYSRNEQHEDSDVDLLVEYDPSLSLFDLFGFRYSLEEVFGKRVDLVPSATVKPGLKPYVMKDVVVLYKNSEK